MLKIYPVQAIDIYLRNCISFILKYILKGRLANASVLCQMPRQERDEESSEHHHEERQAGNQRYLSGLRHQDVPHRQVTQYHYQGF